MKTSEKSTIVIFGATGDLTHRKLIPALYNNYRKGRLGMVGNIVGYARRDWSDDYFRERAEDGIRTFAAHSFDKKIFGEFAKLLSYRVGNLDKKEDYEALSDALVALEEPGTSRLYYLATAPKYYSSACSYLAAAGMSAEEDGSRRIVIEKPFGHDGESAAELDTVVHSAFSEDQVFRIDHYLGKETAQNILFLRFANTIFEPVWNRRYISNVQITVAEQVDVGTRAGYYDETGVLRDMFQNHLLQLLALTAMEPPASLDAEDIRNEKAKVLRAIAPVSLGDTVRAQYTSYCSADGVSPNSVTPTFAALKLMVNTWRWQGVPFYIRSGKALKEKTSEIIVRFQEPPGVIFHLRECDGYTPNAVSICLQPNEGIHVKYQVKVPDRGNASRTVNMSFNYEQAFPDSPIPDSYERLLLDAVQGDASLFARSDDIEASWKIIDPILQAWEANPDGSRVVPPLTYYKPGSWGPEAAESLLAKAGHMWHLGCFDDNGQCIGCSDPDDTSER